MRACFTQKILPLALCFAAGIAAWGAAELTDSSDAEARKRAEADGPAMSRTWLTIHSRPQPRFLELRNAKSDDYFIHLRAKFGADGTVSEIIPVSASLSDGSVAEAVNAARRIKFTPATEDGMPLHVFAEVKYEVGGSYFTGVHRNGRRFCVFSAAPMEPSISILSVLGGIDSEGWRVVYE